MDIRKRESIILNAIRKILKDNEKKRQARGYIDTIKHERKENTSRTKFKAWVEYFRTNKDSVSGGGDL